MGFSTIAKLAGEQLSPYLDKILPKLYRYQFDPSPRIQLAMSSIWNSLVTDNQKTVVKHLLVYHFGVIHPTACFMFIADYAYLIEGICL